MSMMKELAHDHILELAAITNTPVDRMYELYEAVMDVCGDIRYCTKAARVMKENDWAPRFTARAVSLPHFEEIFRFEAMEEEWVEELSMVSGYTEDELWRIYHGIMDDEDEDCTMKERLEDFVICTLEMDW